MTTLTAPPGWWIEREPAGAIRIFRLDGFVMAASFTPEVPDDQARQNYVMGFEAKAPRVYTIRKRGPKRVEGDTIEEVCAAADAAWPPLWASPDRADPGTAISPRDGMTVWYQRNLYLISNPIVSRIPTYPTFYGKEVWRFALIPFAGINDRTGARAVAMEIPSDVWPRGFLIIDPGASWTVVP